MWQRTGTLKSQQRKTSVSVCSLNLPLQSPYDVIWVKCRFSICLDAGVSTFFCRISWSYQSIINSKDKTNCDPIKVKLLADLRYFQYIQLSLSSRAIHGGAYFSDVSGWNSILISVPGPCEVTEWHRLLGFCLTITFCLNPAHQAVSNWNCHWNWRISHLGDHKYLPFVTNPYE